MEKFVFSRFLLPSHYSICSSIIRIWKKFSLLWEMMIEAKGKKQQKKTRMRIFSKAIFRVELKLNLISLLISFVNYRLMIVKNFINTVKIFVGRVSSSWYENQCEMRFWDLWKMEMRSGTRFFLTFLEGPLYNLISQSKFAVVDCFVLAIFNISKTSNDLKWTSSQKPEIKLSTKYSMKSRELKMFNQKSINDFQFHGLMMFLGDFRYSN